MNLQELSERSRLSVRTIRYYITERLLPGPEGRGSSTSYGEEHLGRLLLIKELARQRLPLAEIRGRIGSLPPGELRSLLDETERRGRAEESVLSSSPKDYLGALLEQARERRGAREAAPPEAQAAWIGPGDSWRRIRLGPGIELHVSLQAGKAAEGLLEEIQELARERLKRRPGGRDDE